MLRFLPGVILLQTATAALVYALFSISTPSQGFWATCASIGFTSFFAAFWFGSIANHMKKDALTRAKESLARERERFRISAEQEKSKLIEQTQRRIVKEVGRAHARASWKIGAAWAGALCAGFALLFTEFVILGMLSLVLGGGTLAGYILRARRDGLAYRGAHERKLKRIAPVEIMEIEAAGRAGKGIERAYPG